MDVDEELTGTGHRIRHLAHRQLTRAAITGTEDCAHRRFLDAAEADNCRSEANERADMRDQLTSIYLIRHADAIPDTGLVPADVNEYLDLDLSERGRRQAAALARRLFETLELKAIYASSAKRALQTAEAIAAPFGLAVNTDPRVREVGLAPPPVEHLAPEERPAAARAHLERLGLVAMRDGSWGALPGTEPAEQIRARMREGVDAIAARHAGEAVAIVSHAGSINTFVSQLLGLERDFFFPAGNTSVTLVRYGPSGRVLVRLNDTAHLERMRA